MNLLKRLAIGGAKDVRHWSLLQAELDFEHGSDVDIPVYNQTVSPVPIRMNMRIFFNCFAQAVNDECCER